MKTFDGMDQKPPFWHRIRGHYVVESEVLVTYILNGVSVRLITKLICSCGEVIYGDKDAGPWERDASVL